MFFILLPPYCFKLVGFIKIRCKSMDYSHKYATKEQYKINEDEKKDKGLSAGI
ncbi:hypothetical protein SJDPG2_07530 [Porphyromonas gingivalis SJD2]|nr:hypothetical protein SJDPG2_07530 [Porphyromonas gingivalis SJD2]OWR79224.1 hypothetical protein SJDPG5_04045 [Porphyromonas gingivalis SJD5]